MRRRSRNGLVIEGGIRDLQRVMELPNFNLFCRSVDPTLVGVNIPIRIGEAPVLPGDVVLGTPTGVIFMPAHLAQRVVERSEEVCERDVFGKQRLDEGRYTPGEIDVSVW